MNNELRHCSFDRLRQLCFISLLLSFCFSWWNLEHTFKFPDDQLYKYMFGEWTSTSLFHTRCHWSLIFFFFLLLKNIFHGRETSLRSWVFSEMKSRIVSLPKQSSQRFCRTNLVGYMKAGLPQWLVKLITPRKTINSNCPLVRNVQTISEWS